MLGHVEGGKLFILGNLSLPLKTVIMYIWVVKYVLEANPGIFERIITDSRSQMQGFGGAATPSHLRDFIFQSIQI